jgi:predicted lysophospholipase L1 biosynthesis ABC-type transport system permease subunit
LTGKGLDRLTTDPTVRGRGWDNGVLIRYGPDVEASAVTRQLRRHLGRPDLDAKVVGPQRAAEIVDYRSLGRAPTVLVILLAVAAISSLAQSLSSSVRERRHEIGLLKALGMTRHQVAATIALQSTAVTVVSIIVGFPLGTVGGRLLWSGYAHQVGVLPLSATPTVSLLLAAAVGLILANVVAVIPALNAARCHAAEGLHAE